MAGSQRNHFYMAPPSLHFPGSNDGINSIVATLGYHIGPKCNNQIKRCVGIKKNHSIHRLQRGQHIGSLRLTADGTALALESFYRCIGVHSHNQGIAESARLGKDINMAGMQEIEYSVGEDDLALLARAPCHKIGELRNFSRRVEVCQNFASTLGLKRTLREPSSGTVTGCE
jgi:hypothetical protein